MRQTRVWARGLGLCGAVVAGVLAAAPGPHRGADQGSQAGLRPDPSARSPTPGQLRLADRGSDRHQPDLHALGGQRLPGAARQRSRPRPCGRPSPPSPRGPAGGSATGRCCCSASPAASGAPNSPAWTSRTWSWSPRGCGSACGWPPGCSTRRSSGPCTTRSSAWPRPGRPPNTLQRSAAWAT
jgi:hypothetical protein